jgi:hypothetical protein
MKITEGVRAGLPTVIMPTHEMVLADVDLREPLSVEDDDRYNEHCNNLIRQALAVMSAQNDVATQLIKAVATEGGRMTTEQREQRLEELARPMVRTRYPFDDNGSEDVVSLDEDGNIVVLDIGTR